MRLLDLFCGAGGAAMGYYRAGFTEIVGVDIAPQKRYPFEFVQADALEYVRAHGHEFDVIHASPPCQGYSRMRYLPWLRGRVYPLLIDDCRQALQKNGTPWIIENVEGAPLAGIRLCGTMFGLRVYRHRLFESSEFLFQSPHAKHRVVIGHRAGSNEEGWVNLPGKSTNRINGLRGNGEIHPVAGHFSDMDGAKRAIGIDWMSRDELAQAVPPAYTEFIGRQLLARIIEGIRGSGE